MQRRYTTEESHVSPLADVLQQTCTQWRRHFAATPVGKVHWGQRAQTRANKKSRTPQRPGSGQRRATTDERTEMGVIEPCGAFGRLYSTSSG